MRALFWRRKNAKLDSRLSNLVETSERARKTSRRKTHRVQIDTSYVDQPAHPDELEALEEYELTAGTTEHDTPDSVHSNLDSGAQPHATDTDAGAETDGYEGFEDPDEVLREAIEQLDQAEAREAEAVTREEAAHKEVESQRARVETLQADIERERTARAQAEAAHQTAVAEIAARDEKLTELEAAVSETEAASITPAEPDPETVQQALLVPVLQADLVKAIAENQAATTARELAERRAQSAKEEAKAATKEIEALRASLKDAEASATQAGEGVAKELAEAQQAMAAAAAEKEAIEVQLKQAVDQAKAAASEREKLEARIAKLETELETQSAALTEADKKAAHLAATLATANTEIADLKSSMDQAGDAEKHIAETVARAEAAEQEAKDHQQTITAHLAEVERLKAACQAAEEKAASIEEEAVDLRKTAAQAELAERRRVETQTREEAVRKEVESQRRRIEELEETLLTQRTELADVKAQREGAAKRADTARKELDDLRSTAATATPSNTDETSSISKANPPSPTDAECASTVIDVAAVVAKVKSAQPQPVSAEPTEAADNQAATTEAEAQPSVNEGETAPTVETLKSPEPQIDASTAPEASEASDPPAKKPSILRKPLQSIADAEPVVTKAQTTPPTTRAPQLVPEPQVSKAATAVERVAPSVTRSGAGDSLVQSRIARATSAKEKAKENRNAKRVASRKLASLWNDRMSAALSCTMLDRSSTGAKLEVLEDRYNDRMNAINVGDRFTVTLNYAQETTSIACEIMWVAGRRCGVRFCGQIVTQVNKPAKRALPKKAVEKASASSAIKSLFGAGAR